MFEFTVPDGDYDYDFENETYVWKNLVFTENKIKQAKETIKEYVSDGTAFTMVYLPKG